MSNQVNPVDAAIAAAKAQAETQQMTQVVPTNTVTTVASNAALPVTRAPSMDDLTSGAFAVDGFLRLKDSYFTIGDKADLMESITVSIDLNNSGIMPFIGYRYGKPAQYIKTYDGVTSVKGGVWSQEVARALLVEPDACSYTAADISMTLLEPAKNLKGAEVYPAGYTVGHSSTVTAKKNISAFLKDVERAGLENGIVTAVVTAEAKSKNGNDWSVIKLTLVNPEPTK